MKTVKNIKIATGVKRIELGNGSFAPLQIRDVLKEHRESLIDRLLLDLKTYLSYQFTSNISKEQLNHIKDKLFSLKASNIDLARYGDIIDEVMANEVTYVKSELFYQEINITIGEELNPSQLMLVK
jgi:hypothetical protein